MKSESNKTKVASELIKMLCCPACKGGLAYKGNKLRCRKCKRVYPIKDGIPIMLPK